MERKKRRAQATAGSCDITAASSFEQRKAGLAEAGSARMLGSAPSRLTATPAERTRSPRPDNR